MQIPGEAAFRDALWKEKVNLYDAHYFVGVKFINMSKKLFSVIIFIFLFLTACSGKSSDFESQGYTIDEVNLNIESITDSYKIVVVNDLHLQVNNDEVAEENSEFMDNRIAEFSSIDTTTHEKLLELPEAINDIDADLVIFAGDMIDFCSKANTDALSGCFQKLTTDYIYLRSDHDLEPYWLKVSDYADCNLRQSEICDNSRILIYDLGSVIVLGFNMSQNNIDSESLEKVKDVFSLNKPVIVATHVPFDSSVSDDLKLYSEEVRNGRHLYWGYDAEYFPNAETQEFLNLIYADDSPVVYVIGAHLHSKWDGLISQKITEHIFAPCYMGNIGIININDPSFQT